MTGPLQGGSVAGAEQDLRLRRRLFADAVDLMGKQMDLLLSISVVRPLPDDATRIERGGVTGFIGQQTRPGATPIAATIAHSSDSGEGGSTRYAGLRGPNPGALLEGFSTMPLPTVMSRGPQGGLVHIIDPAATQGENSVDVVLGHRMAPVSHPATHDTPVLNLVTRIRTPTRRLLFDVYLHRSLALSSVPLLAAYMSLPSPGVDTTPRWHERLPVSVDLRVLGPGMDASDSDAWPRHRELTQHLFQSLEWPFDAFIGYRCDVTFPVSSATYMMTFDFSPADDRDPRSDYTQAQA
ncbi:MAG: hypothetical protein KIT24_08615 [Phycisphaeraceae bacterium]|nr:hypothetical protein [Phycisphaeraceae bacterium]